MSEVKTGTSVNIRSQWGEVLAEWNVARSRTSTIRSMIVWKTLHVDNPRQVKKSLCRPLTWKWSVRCKQSWNHHVTREAISGRHAYDLFGLFHRSGDWFWWDEWANTLYQLPCLKWPKVFLVPFNLVPLARTCLQFLFFKKKLKTTNAASHSWQPQTFKLTWGGSNIHIYAQEKWTYIKTEFELFGVLQEYILPSATWRSYLESYTFLKELLPENHFYPSFFPQPSFYYS